MLLKVIKEEETEMKILIGYELKQRKSVVDLNNYNRKQRRHDKIKAIFFDIDGTIRSFKTKTIPDNTKETLKN